MNQRNLGHVLMLAGAIAALGLLFIFYFPPVPRLLGMENKPVYTIGRMLMGVPYLAALWQYFYICRKIGANLSFCPENARRMDTIAALLFSASALWATALAAAGIAKAFTSFAISASALAVIVLALMATLAVGLVAKMMALLVGRASSLQEENDLTI